MKIFTQSARHLYFSSWAPGMDVLSVCCHSWLWVGETNKRKINRAAILSASHERGRHGGRKGCTIKGWSTERGEERVREGTEAEEEDGREAEKKGDVTSNRQPMGVREGGREHGRRGGCVFLSLQHQQRGEGHNQFHREEEERQVEEEERRKKREAGCFQRRGASPWR